MDDATAREVEETVSVHDEIEKMWARQAEAMGVSVEHVKVVAAVMAGVQSFADQGREPSVVLPMGFGAGEANYMHLCGIPVRYVGVSKPTLGFELET